MQIIHTIFDWIGIPVLAVIFMVLFFIEEKFQLRKRVQSKWKRSLINNVIAVPSFLLLRFLLLPVMVWLSIFNESLHFGLNFLFAWPAWLEGIVAFLLLDYTNYLWHTLNHRIPFLWRFHLVHHTDPDLDLQTAIRFHFGEMIGSVFFRGAMVLLTGASPFTVILYEIVFEAATLFHHSNTRLPILSEKILNKFIVTPRMHGIHHSIVKEETDSNYSVIFSFWDRLHKTITLNVPQKEVVMGVPGYNSPEELNISYLLRLPFTKIRTAGKVIRDAGNTAADKGELVE